MSVWLGIWGGMVPVVAIAVGAGMPLSGAADGPVAPLAPRAGEVLLLAANAPGPATSADRQYVDLVALATEFRKSSKSRRSDWNKSNAHKYWVSGTGTVSDLGQMYTGVGTAGGGVTTVMSYRVTVRISRDTEAVLSYAGTEPNSKNLEKVRRGHRFSFRGNLERLEANGRRISGIINAE